MRITDIFAGSTRLSKPPDPPETTDDPPPETTDDPPAETTDDPPPATKEGDRRQIE
jgi:hypothetical protein